jgi:hypothetical protein
VTRRGGVLISVRGEAAPRRRKRGDDDNWDDVNLIGREIKKIHAVDSTDTNGR